MEQLSKVPPIESICGFLFFGVFFHFEKLYICLDFQWNDDDREKYGETLFVVSHIPKLSFFMFAFYTPLTYVGFFTRNESDVKLLPPS